MAWSVSFYPQIWINFKRKSVVGLNFDYVALNITGFVSYSMFNVCLYFFKYAQDQYEHKYPHSNVPVETNDVVFALHAVFATLIVIFQIIFYDRGDQRVSLVSTVILTLIWIAYIALAFIVALTNWITLLTYLYVFSYVKLGITIIKYIPQAWYNYQRKSTIGWSIENIILDFTGGALSMIQMFMLAYNYDDWITLFTNFTKFGLGAISIFFDIIFMVQHYILYRHGGRSEIARLFEDDNQSGSYQGSRSDLEHSSQGIDNPIKPQAINGTDYATFGS